MSLDNGTMISYVNNKLKEGPYIIIKKYGNRNYILADIKKIS